MNPRNSLRKKLLQMLLSTMLLVMIVSAFVGYSIAFRNATLAYDQTLFDTALAVLRQVQVTDGKPSLNLLSEAEQVLLTDNFDRVYFRVLDAVGGEIGGNRPIPLPEGDIPKNKGYFYDAEVEGEAIRVAAFLTEKARRPLTILAAETRIKRDNLVREILIGMLLPELILIGVTPILIWFGIRAGLKPLEDLREQLANRSQNDLRPIEAKEMAYEIQPVIRQINDLFEQVEASQEAQQTFVSNAAHQLRTPIAALRAQFEAILREPASAQHAQLSQMLPALERLTRLIHQLLSLARAEPSDESARQSVDLSEIVRDLAEDMLAQAIAKGIDLGFDLETAKVKGTALLLREAVGNLIDNALRYTPPEGCVTVTCRAEGADSGGVVLRVEDSGPGIPEELREKVFDRFYRLPGSSSDGSGLGLAVARQIARQHDASIVVGRSDELGGASVSLEFRGL
ncbi:MAG: sensor histidine kinase N-terminal domain-containing protein [Candidatus Accumulibacter sp.]|jgi:two-component system sensor histidine kinase TctE|nr:sensor histidine kinase N-terminal domain-containing protein [Accumulibacter sp.]